MARKFDLPGGCHVSDDIHLEFTLVKNVPCQKGRQQKKKG